MNPIPAFSQAQIDERKLVHYLLSLTHPVGQPKARFFLGLGFRSEAAFALREALLLHVQENPVGECEETQFGSKYIVTGPLRAPNGRVVEVCSVWFLENGEEAVRFVTAYPDRRRADDR